MVQKKIFTDIHQKIETVLQRWAHPPELQQRGYRNWNYREREVNGSHSAERSSEMRTEICSLNLASGISLESLGSKALADKGPGGHKPRVCVDRRAKGKERQ